MKISLIIATYNRGSLLMDLLRDLSAQEAAGTFDVTIVDDGSTQPATPLIDSVRWPYPVRVIQQENHGQAHARHRGIAASDGDIVVIVDDDMRLPTHFLAAHRELHNQGAEVVLGFIRAASDLAAKPIFERFHAAQLALFVAGVRAGRPIPGTALCTGNVSFRRKHYIDVGGFDQSLQRSEDRELGIRLQKAGARFAFSERAYTMHGSDHHNREVWLRRAFLYGMFDLRIAQKHPEDPRNDPWHYLFLVNPISRPFLLAAVASPEVGTALSARAMRAAELLDRLGFESIAIKATTFVFGVEYFRGVGSEYASGHEALKGLLRLVRARRESATRS